MRDFVHDIPGGHYFPFRIQPIGSADPTVSHVILRVPWPARVRRVAYAFDADVTGQDTNTFNLNLINRGTAGAGTAELANRDYVSGTNDSAYVLRELYKPSDPLTVDAGTVLDLQREKVGNGMDMPGLWGFVEIEGA